VIVHEGAPDQISQDLFTENVTYTVTVSAKWNKRADRTNYGEATYLFNARVVAPASFYLNDNEVTYGDFVVLSAKNVINPSEIVFTSQPSIGYEPTFFEYGGYYHALVPFSMVCEEENQKATDYVFTLTYGDVTDSFNVKVNERNIKKAYESAKNYPKEFIEVHRSETALNEFAEIMRSPFNNLENELYWLGDNMLTVPVTGKTISRGFGLQIILEATNQKYWHEGVNYKVKANDPVYACLPGKVIYVGETRLSGTTVVVDHGAGLKSLYAHLGTTSVSVGDEVEKGDMIAIVGSSGFCSGTSFHFGLYVFDVPVRYYDYETYGINLESSVAEALGLKQSGSIG
jgi:murein DD-endopeptidase MepM/ murein hydrolase activator NlpD